MRTSRINRSRALVCAAAVLLLGGCGGSDTGTVNGKVTYKGKALNSGEVTFVAEGKTRSAVIGPDGTYTLNEVPPGPHQVSVLVRGQQYATAAPATPKGAPPMPGTRVQPVPVPVKYASPASSGLTYRVAAGSQTIDIPLKE